MAIIYPISPIFYRPCTTKERAVVHKREMIYDDSLASRECLSLLSSAVDFVKNVQPKNLLPSSGKLKREVSMEEIIQVVELSSTEVEKLNALSA